MSPEWYEFAILTVHNTQFLILLFRYQTHQLRNVSNDYCATINCYRYDDNDTIQWNLFDYVNDENGQMGNFFPNTDFSYGEMRELVLKEWNDRH